MDPRTPHSARPGVLRRRIAVIAPAAALLTLILIVAITATTGSARPTAVPGNTQPPVISGKAQAGMTLKGDNGTWTGTPADLRVPVADLQRERRRLPRHRGAQGNEYTVKAADAGNTLRVVVNAKNADGTGSATSVPTAQIAAASGGTTTRPRRPTPPTAARRPGHDRDRRRRAACEAEHRPVPGQPEHDHPRHTAAQRALPRQRLRRTRAGRTRLRHRGPVRHVRRVERAAHRLRRLGDDPAQRAPRLPGQPQAAAARDVRARTQVRRKPPRRHVEPAPHLLQGRPLRAQGFARDV